jgi:hypothetical protein
MENILIYGNTLLDISKNYQQHDEDEQIRNGKKMEPDVYLSQQKLAFEYHPETYYKNIYSSGNLWTQREQEENNKITFRNQGITLIEIPYWWDFKKESLIATIHQVRPDLIPQKGIGKAIPFEPPNGLPKGVTMIHSFY